MKDKTIRVTQDQVIIQVERHSSDASESVTQDNSIPHLMIYLCLCKRIRNPKYKQKWMLRDNTENTISIGCKRHTLHLARIKIHHLHQLKLIPPTQVVRQPYQ